MQTSNRFRDNTFKNESNNSRKSNSKSSKNAPLASEKMPAFNLRDGRAIKVIGLFLLLSALFLLLSFVSYLFTWKEDQSYVIAANGGWSNLFKTVEELKNAGLKQVEVFNWTGKLGALLAHQFIYSWFGVASFLFIFLFFLIGYRMVFKVRILNIRKSIAYSLFLIFFTSTLLGFFHSFLNNTPHYLEGQFGFFTNQLLRVQIGTVGIGIVLCFIALIALVIAYNIDFNHPTLPSFLKSKEEEEVESLSDDDEFYTKTNVQRMNTQAKKAETLEAESLLNPSRSFIPVVPQTNAVPIEDAFSIAPVSAPIASEITFDTIKPQANQSKELPKNEEAELEFTVAPVVVEPKAIHSDDAISQKSAALVAEFGMYDPTLELSGYQFPPLDLLENYSAQKVPIDTAELEANKNKIVETLNNYDIKISKIKATIGPTVTLYEIVPAPGVRISKIKNLENDIALSLAALGIRIIAPMPGQGTVGIEVPNKKPEMVSMRSVLSHEKFQNTTMDLPIALGKTISNEVYVTDLAKMPHLLVAGATGQGKSVGINAILTSLLYKKHPSQLKLVLVDPKKVELSLFKKIERHFLAKLPGGDDAIITDTKKVIHTLNSLCIEMDQRYDLLKDAGVRNLKEYNVKFVNRKLSPENGHRFLPFIVLVIDEFADLMMTAGKEIETPIARLAQLARAIGIHLVLATQRPAVSVITGTIKANFPARLSFRVMTSIDSRTILDSGGADQLIGRGDMLLSLGSDLIRLQCAYLDTPEAEAVSEFIGSQRGYPDAYLLPEYVDENGEGSGMKDFDPDDRDSLFEDAARLIVMHQSGSTSLIQRKMKLGYNRAGRIMDQLEATGVVGPFQGSKVRDVLIPDDYALEQFLDNLVKKG